MITFDKTVVLAEGNPNVSTIAPFFEMNTNQMLQPAVYSFENYHSTFSFSLYLEKQLDYPAA